MFSENRVLPGGGEQRKRENDPSEKLVLALSEWSQAINVTMSAALEDPKRAGAILDSECRISMRAFMKKRGGPYAKENKEDNTSKRSKDRSIEEDEETIHNQELTYSGALDDSALQRYGTKDAGEILLKYRIAERKRDGSLAEAAVVCVLNKFLGERYVVVRASLFDDYENGVDTLILDKQNGGVVCAFDEVVGLEGDLRHTKKIDRAKDRLAKHGGMRVKYGLAFEGSKLSRKEMPNIPGFCISLTHEELRTLLRKADFSPTSEASSEELAVFQGVILALRNQESVMKEKMSSAQRQHVSDLIAYCEQLSVDNKVIHFGF